MYDESVPSSSSQGVPMVTQQTTFDDLVAALGCGNQAA